MLKNRFSQVLGILLAAGSCALAVPIGFWAIFMILAVNFQGNLACLHAAGLALVFAFGLHVIPMSLAKDRKQLVLFSAAAVASAWLFELLYYVAKVGASGNEDPSFLLATILCVFPLLRALVRSLGLATNEA